MNALTRELLVWVAARPRTYDETMDAWRSNCPRHSTWEDACIDGLVEVTDGEVRLTTAGSAAVRNFTSYSVSG
uniref:Uncharacterized protein n=1 Tax=Solibacter usitatus (strain Ellin6076) TaxID=234267 RepID=Q01XN6_SOLUE